MTARTKVADAVVVAAEAVAADAAGNAGPQAGTRKARAKKSSPQEQKKKLALLRSKTQKVVKHPAMAMGKAVAVVAGAVGVDVVAAARAMPPR
jgi:hypothetical protein